ncbi:MAG: hypothetical protein ACK4N5_15450, partial [Myxococcales bacterium]
MSQPSPTAPASTIPKALQTLLESLSDVAFAGRLRLVYVAASRAIHGLRELELGSYEESIESGAPDLSMWEALAPVIRDTVMDVNELLGTIRTHFPSEVPGGIAEMIGNAIEDTGVGDPSMALEARRINEAIHQIHTLSSVLANEITNLGERMRSPQVVSDRWNLLSDLQYFRGKFRSVIGDLVFLSAYNLGEITREQAIPEYVDDVRTAIELRRGVTDLARLGTLFVHRVKSASDATLAPHLDDLARALDAFGRSGAYVGLRAQDKRRLVEFRHTLERMRKEGTSTVSAALSLVQELATFAMGLSQVNKRDCLIQYDRALLAACSVKLENAESVRTLDAGESARLLAEGGGADDSL